MEENKESEKYLKAAIDSVREFESHYKRRRDALKAQGMSEREVDRTLPPLPEDLTLL